MALYWHPFLAELLRMDYGDRLIVEEEVPLGDMPLKVDLLLIRRDLSVMLPFPFNCLGARTLVEYKSPDDVAGQESLVKLEAYGLLYCLREKIERRQDLTLWLVASHFQQDVSHPDGAFLAGEREVGAGVRGGTVDGFPTFFIDLNRLPVLPETLPLVMVAKGPQERALVEFLVDHFQQYPHHLRFLRELHVQMLGEVLRMRQLTPEQIGIDYQALLDLIGEERALDMISEERILKDLMRRRGEEWILDMLKRLKEPQDTQTEPEGAA
ncbi:MAG: hypothetical protein NZT92_06930 [Abditibacteriales bacterium]|nr:hypothetical protein [Abditibacteriales bacterium]MDW8364734.1 hypothetical protein [Abditibacteriales bacterium]